MSIQTYCDRADLEAIWSAPAVLRAVDDTGSGSLGPAEEAIVLHAIERAANKMNASLEMQYTLSDLAHNGWCRDGNAMIAVYLLATRRGNPAPDQIQEQYEDLMNDLSEIRHGRLNVPQAGQRDPAIPEVTSFDTDLTSKPPKIVRR